jgi:hypothetical protein
MKNRFLLTIVTAFSLALMPNITFAQVPDLGSAANFVFFSTTGAVSNAGISRITGNAGANTGAVSGFGSLNGTVYNADVTSAQCSADLLVAYAQLNGAVATLFPGVLLGNGQVLNAGVYSIPAATSLNLTLTLDAQGDPSAVFIFQINGAFSTNTLSRVMLINGASACNVFWKIEGALSMAAASTMRGTVIVNNAAISMASGDTLEGRALSTTGAVAVDGVLANVGCGFIALPIKLLSFSGACDNGDIVLKWSTAMETNNRYCTVERSDEGINWGVLGRVDGAGNADVEHSYSFTDWHPAQTGFYRLIQTDLDGNSIYGKVLAVGKCNDKASGDLTLFPNPSSGKFDLLYSGDASRVNSTEIFNALGERIILSPAFLSNIDLSGKPAGIYVVQVHLNEKAINRQIVIKGN